jgi:23S rRNA pseudouridine1911/1915/1917 synthase
LTHPPAPENIDDFDADPTASTVCEWPIGPSDAGTRIDIFLRDNDTGVTRSALKQLIENGAVSLDGVPETRPSRKLKAGQRLRLSLPAAQPACPEPEDIPLDIRYSDAAIAVIDKPQGLVVHPSPGHPTGTLVNALLHACPPAGGDPARPGIVHRLDKDTSGLMVVARSEAAYQHLVAQFHAQTVTRRYLALVQGNPPDAGTWNTLHGRSEGNRKRFSTRVTTGKPAISAFVTVERFPGAALLRVTLQTGRTHQVRVHCHDHHFSILGDPVYAPRRLSPELRSLHARLPGQALHAEHLAFAHPLTGERLAFSSPPPAAFLDALHALRAPNSVPP